MGRPARAAERCRRSFSRAAAPPGRHGSPASCSACNAGGVDPNAADLAIGTSAGSIVGAQLRSGMTLPNLFEAQKRSRRRGSRPGRATSMRATSLQRPCSSQSSRRRRRACANRRARNSPPRYRARRSGSQRSFRQSDWPDLRPWPQRKLDSSPSTRSTVASKCIDGHESGALTCGGRQRRRPVVHAAHHDRRTALHRRWRCGTNITWRRQQGSSSPSYRTRTPSCPRTSNSAIGGSHVVVLTPDAGALDAIGPNTLDASRKPGAADAGLRQGSNAATACATSGALRALAAVCLARRHPEGHRASQP